MLSAYCSFCFAHTFYLRDYKYTLIVLGMALLPHFASLPYRCNNCCCYDFNTHYFEFVFCCFFFFFFLSSFFHFDFVVSHFVFMLNHHILLHRMNIGMSIRLHLCTLKIKRKKMNRFERKRGKYNPSEWNETVSLEIMLWNGAKNERIGWVLYGMEMKNQLNSTQKCIYFF